MSYAALVHLPVDCLIGSGWLRQSAMQGLPQVRLPGTDTGAGYVVGHRIELAHAEMRFFMLQSFTRLVCGPFLPHPTPSTHLETLATWGGEGASVDPK